MSPRRYCPECHGSGGEHHALCPNHPGDPEEEEPGPEPDFEQQAEDREESQREGLIEP